MNNRNMLRQEIRNKRRQISASQQQEQALLLCEKLIAQPELKHAKRIAIYLANDGELDTQRFINWCWQHQISVYLPVLHPFSKGHLLFLHYTKNSIMRKNQYGIFEPTLDVRDIIAIAELDIIFTPLVAFDSLGNRLGMGGGFYDRTLAHWHSKYQQNKQAKPLPIGLAHDCQQVAAIPHELWDIPLPQVITPSISYRFDI